MWDMSLLWVILTKILTNSGSAVTLKMEPEYWSEIRNSKYPEGCPMDKGLKVMPLMQQK